MKVFYEKVLDFANKKVLGFVPILYENILPSCLLVMEQDVIVLSPNKYFFAIVSLSCSFYSAIFAIFLNHSGVLLSRCYNVTEPQVKMVKYLDPYVKFWLIMLRNSIIVTTVVCWLLRHLELASRI